MLAKTSREAMISFWIVIMIVGEVLIIKHMLHYHFYPECLADEGFLCSNGECIDYHRRCDGTVDCTDMNGSDEENCGKLDLIKILKKAGW